MTEFYNPDSWMDVLDHIWIGLVLISVAAVPSWFAYRNHTKIQGVSDQVKGVAAQVVNGHTGQPPMRADLDDIRAAVHEIRTDIRDLREELRIERDDISELQQRVIELTPAVVRRRRKEMP